MRSHVDHSHRIAHTVVSFKFVWHWNYLSCPLTMHKNHNGYWLVLIDNLENNLEKSTFHKQHLQPQKKLIRLLFWCTCPVMLLHIIISTICHTCMVFHPVLFGGKKMEITLTVLWPKTFRNSSDAHGELQVFVYTHAFL